MTEVRRSYPTVIYHVQIPQKKFKLCPTCGNPEIYLGVLEDDDVTAVIVCEKCGNELLFHSSPTTAREEVELFNYEKHIVQLKLAFDPPQICSFCGEHIDLNYPPTRLLVSLGENELYCSRECYENKHYHSSTPTTRKTE